MALERLAEDAHGDLVYTFTKPWSDRTTGIRLSPLELLEKLAALVPLPRVHLVRDAGCLAPHSKLRDAIIPTPRQQGVDGEEAPTGPPSWSWARLLGRVFALDLATCPFCRCGSLRIIAAITQESVITRILRHCKLASVPHLLLPLPVLAKQRLIGWPKPTTSRVASEARCAQRRCLSPLCACRISLGHAGAGGASRTIGAESMTFALAPDIQ